MEFFIKNSQRRVDPRTPQTHPDFEAAIHKGQQMAKTITFESEGDRRDYERQVKSNPNNVYGLPPFFPPERIRVMLNDVREVFASERALELERMRQASITFVHVFCMTCGKETRHSISPVQQFCCNCGTQKNIHHTLEVA